MHSTCAVGPCSTIRRSKSHGSHISHDPRYGAPFLDDGSNIQCQNAYGMKYWFPIPQKERDINANLPQNPGW